MNIGKDVSGLLLSLKPTGPTSIFLTLFLQFYVFPFRKLKAMHQKVIIVFHISHGQHFWHLPYLEKLEAIGM